jgi:sialate O-acetylesterase
MKSRRSCSTPRCGSIYVFSLMILLTFPSAEIRAEIIMPVTFGDGMVLQRDAPLRIFGQASEGAEVSIEFNGQKERVTAESGRWMAQLEPMPAGGPYELRISGDGSRLDLKDVMLGEVWLAGGQSNMAMALRSTKDAGEHLPANRNSQLRLLRIPVTEFGAIRREGVGWQQFDRDSVKNFSAVAYFFAVELQKRLGVPVGIIGSYRGATWNENWMTPESIKCEPALKYLFDRYEEEYARFENEAAYERAYQEYLLELREWRAKGGWSHGMVPFAPLGPKAYQRPSGLYNCMIRPLQPYSIKGCIWYQGEGNSSRHKEFRTLFPAFVDGWRKTWENPDMPFYFVQLPAYKDESWPQFRQAQLDCAKSIRHCGMVVPEGCGDATDIHPKTKKPIGDRLAIAVSSEVYGQKHVPYGPIFRSVHFEGKVATVSFDCVGRGLVLRSKSTRAFEISGTDKVYKEANYRLENGQLVLWHDEVSEPKYVRYAYTANPDMCLFSRDGLPASPFTSECPGLDE